MFGGMNIALFLIRIIDFYEILIVISCILTWLPIPREGVLADIVGAIHALVRPYLGLFRRFIPPFGGLDFSPILAIVVLWLIERLIMSILI